MGKSREEISTTGGAISVIVWPEKDRENDTHRREPCITISNFSSSKVSSSRKFPTLRWIYLSIYLFANGNPLVYSWYVETKYKKCTYIYIYKRTSPTLWIIHLFTYLFANRNLFLYSGYVETKYKNSKHRKTYKLTKWHFTLQMLI